MYYHGLPQVIKESLDLYKSHGIRTGGFLEACLANDFLGAVGKADSDNIHRLREIAIYIHMELPSGCHGSYEIVSAWIKERQEEASRGKAND